MKHSPNTWEKKRTKPSQQEKVLYICPIHGRISKPCVHSQPPKYSECTICGKEIIIGETGAEKVMPNKSEYRCYEDMFSKDI